MNDKELDALLDEALGADVEKPNYLDTRLRGGLALARKEGRGISLWWLPLALALAAALPLFLLGLLAPWPVGPALRTCAGVTVAGAAIFTAVGLKCFDLKEKGRVLL